MTARVAVTGMGVISSAGNTPADLWRTVVAGRSTARRITRFDPSEFRSRLAMEVDDFDFSAHTGGRSPGRMDRFSQFGVAAAGHALEDARLSARGDTTESTGVYLGSALGGIAYGEEQHARYLELGTRAISPSLALSIFSGAAATNVAIRFGLQGPAISNANSCASGAIAIGEAFRRIRAGDLDIALAGGVECPLAPLTFGAFSVIRAMSSRNDCPSSACRPFDLDRDGFVMGEGAAVLVLENWNHACARGAIIHAEVLGYGTTNDAHHMTAPLAGGSQAARAIRLGLEDAGVDPGEINYISAHATGTRLGDEAEAAALRSVFPENMPPVCATKPVHGHPLGASAAIEAIITIMGMRNSFLPGIVNLDRRDQRCDVNAVSVPGRAGHANLALCNAFGFGGINASVVMRRPD